MVDGISLVVVGAEGCGKTTVVGHLSRLLGGFSEDILAERKALAKELGSPANAGTWLLDTLVSERERGSTLEPSVASFQSSAFRYSAVDTPGSSCSKATLAAASLADVALLLISAVPGESEAHIESGQTKEFALACFTMGIKEMVVLVTKMDDMTVDYSMARFDAIKASVAPLLKEVGYKQKEAPFVPISGLIGDNLTEKSAETSWYGGQPLIGVLDTLGPINRPAEKPLRLPVLQVHEIAGTGMVVTGRVETGSIKPGNKVLFAPSGATAEVESLQVGGQDVSDAKSGDVVSLCVGEGLQRGLDVSRGMVISAQSGDPACAAESFVAQVIVLDHPGSIRPGYCPAIAVGTALVPCEFEEFLTKSDRKGKEVEKSPELVKANEVLTARLRPRAPLVVEAFGTYPALGRFAVRDHGRTIAVGVVKEVTKRPVPPARSESENRYFSG
eukprot:TRINITY_DN32043_c0_g1_i1.p1 TRINITY_DN32043_c0_g1~~TRINITY_DN32043_c0_g1_i1.p1  ORF type:complete len:467 (-),score=78.75 TRINITY_DN32043_c0_g1_i1:65-1399(-)